ncbi:hypothetical protein V2J09_019734 [Rumex salicifolius]
MNGNYPDRDFCYHHPNHVLVGVCPFCLNEKLLAVAANQLRRRRNNRQEEGVSRNCHSRKSSGVGISKIFAFGSFINRLEILHHHNRRGTYDFDGAAASDTESTSSGLEDSFISIKIEEDGVALWDKSKASNASEQEQEMLTKPNEEGYFGENGCKSTVVVEHKKTIGRGSLRWWKRIGHLFQLVRRKRSSKANATSSHVNGVAGFRKVKNKGWIGTLTKRRTSKDLAKA